MARPGDDYSGRLAIGRVGFLDKVGIPFGTLELWHGLQFWPLVGDVTSPEQSGRS